MKTSKSHPQMSCQNRRNDKNKLQNKSNLNVEEKPTQNCKYKCVCEMSIQGKLDNIFSDSQGSCCLDERSEYPPAYRNI